MSRDQAHRYGPFDRTECPSATRRAPQYRLRLYISGRTPDGERAISSLIALCERAAPGRYALDIVNLTELPHGGQVDRILATPTLLRLAPAPERRLIGDLSDNARVVAGLGLQVASSRC